MTRPSQLTALLAPRPTALIWRRRLSATLLRWLGDVARRQTEDVSLELSFDHGALVSLLGPLPPGPEREAWTSDIERLVRLFARLSKASTVRAKLALFSTDKCRKFHADYRALRLLCTYVGPGTECIDDAHVERSALGRPDANIEQANARIVRRPSSVVRARAGDVVLLKGEHHPGCQGRGAVHRSPSIAHLNQRRLVLTLDADGAEP